LGAKKTRLNATHGRFPETQCSRKPDSVATNFTNADCYILEGDWPKSGVRNAKHKIYRHSRVGHSTRKNTSGIAREKKTGVISP